MTSRPQLLIAAWLLAAGCRGEPEPAPVTAPMLPPRPVATNSAPEPAPEPWRVSGNLVGTTRDRAIVLTDKIVSVDIQTGEVLASANTAARDPVPSFDRFLPRYGEGDRSSYDVERLADMPVYAGGEVAVFMRGTDDAVTSLVGLDATTLEEAWVLELAEQRPLKSCATKEGVLTVPKPGSPSRFVDWLGKQRWLREFGEADEEVVDFACGDAQIAVVLSSGRSPRLRRFESATGELVDESEQVPNELSTTVTRAADLDAPVRQDGTMVVGTPTRH